MKIGIMVDSLKMPLREGIVKARELGAEGLQMYAVDGEMAPEVLSAADRKELLDFVVSQGLEVSAICGDLGGHGFERPDENAKKIERSKRIVELAKDLGTNVITTHLGVIPEDESAPAYVAIRGACEEIGSFADSMGATFAVETGPQTPERLKAFIESLSNTGVKVNYDPANLAMVIGCDVVEGARILGNHIVHTHAKDGVMVSKGDPARIYDHFAEGGITDLRLDDYIKEVPLGEGDVNFPRYLEALQEIGYDGYLTIEREVGPTPEKDIALAVQFLKTLLTETE